MIKLSYFGALIASVLSGFLSLAVQAAIPACENPDLLPDQAKVPCASILEFKKGATLTERKNIVSRNGATVRFNYKSISAAAVTVPDIQAFTRLKNDSEVIRVIPDRTVSAFIKPDARGGKGKKGGGSSSSGQVVPSGIARIGATPGVSAYTGAGVGIAIVDTGIDLVNTDLNVSANCFTAYSSCNDDNGHGTHVAGIAAAKNNDQDVVGMAPDATVYAVKVLDASGSGSDSDIMAGLDWIANNADVVTPKIRVVNLSLGRPGVLGDNPLMEQLFAEVANNHQVSIIVAAGNNYSKSITEMVPATYPSVMAVASSAAADGTNAGCRSYSGIIAKDTASYFTTDGSFNATTGIGVTISAPGEKQENIKRSCGISSVGILSLKAGGGVTRMSGTSMASPHVAGAVALLLEQIGGSLDPESVRDMLRSSADRKGVAPLDSPTSVYSYDGEREGVLSACNLLGVPCP